MFENIFEKGYLVDLHIRRWSFQVRLDPADLAIAREDLPKEIVLGRKYLLPREEADKFRRIEIHARSFVKNRSFNFPVGNAAFVPIKLLSEIQEELEKTKEAYETALVDLIDRYTGMVADAEPRFRKAAQRLWRQSGKKGSEEEFIESFLSRIEVALPTRKSLRRRFEFSFSFFVVSLPDGDNGLKMLNVEAAERYRQQAEKQIDSFLGEVVKQLREETYKVCTRVSSLITEGKAVSENTMQSLRDYIDRFRTMNFVGDREISSQLKQLEEQYLVREAKEVREEPQLQENFKRALDVLVEKASDYTDISRVTGRLRRQLQI